MIATRHHSYWRFSFRRFGYYSAGAQELCVPA